MEFEPPNSNELPFMSEPFFFCRSQVDALYCQIQGKGSDHNEQHQQSDNHRRHPMGNCDDIQLLVRYLGIKQLGAYDIRLDTYRQKVSRSSGQKTKSGLLKECIHLYLLLELSHFPNIKYLR